MLEKNENFLYFDAHFHLADCIRDSRVKHGNDTESYGNDTTYELSLSGLTRQSAWYACTCSHSVEEWKITEALRQAQGPWGPHIYLSYGLHPQSAGHINVDENAAFLEQLLQQKKLNAIGEAGFDYFNDEFKSNAAIQEQMFNLQLDLALQYNMPMVIHCNTICQW